MTTPLKPSRHAGPIDALIKTDARTLSAQLQALRQRFFAPATEKVLRRFTSGEAARLIGVSDSYLRQLSLAGEGPHPETGVGGRRLYTLEQIHQLRKHLADLNPGAKGRAYLPHGGLEVIANYQVSTLGAAEDAQIRQVYVLELHH